MAVSATTNLSNSLRRTYADAYFKAFQDDFTPLLDELEECKDAPTRGTGWYFPFYFRTPQNWRVAAEGGAQGNTKQRSEVQGTVLPVEWLAWMQITELLKLMGTKEAAWNGGELNRQMKETVTDITKGMQRMFTMSHGTGRLAVVNAATVTTNTFVAKLDEGVNALMEGDEIEFYDLDSGGSIQGASTTVDKINRQTRTVTFTGSARSLTADWGVYKAGDYGRGCNGFQNLIDNGVFADDHHGQSRATYDKLKAQVRDPGTPTALTEEAMRQICDDIYVAGGEVDAIQCNVGVLNSFFDIAAGDRRYNMEGTKGGTTKFNLGYKEGDALFSYDRGSMVIKKNVNMPHRTMWFYSMKTAFMKHTLRKLGWLDENGSLLRMTPGTSGYVTSWSAYMYAAVNISCPYPIWNGALRNILDQRAGDVAA